MESSGIRRSRPPGHPNVLLITIDRPPVNAMTLAAHRELLAALRSVEDDPVIRCVVLTGAGDRSARSIRRRRSNARASCAGFSTPSEATRCR